MRAVATLGADGGTASSGSDAAQRTGASRLLRRVRLIVVAVHAALAAPVIVQAVYHPDRFVGPDDFTTHLRAALPVTFTRPWVPGPPHFVWHGLVKLLDLVSPGKPYLLAAVLVTVAFAGLTGLVWFEVLRMPVVGSDRMRVRWAAVASVALVCMESPATLAGWEAIRTQSWLPLHAYHGPTGPSARPFVALLVICFVNIASDRVARSDLGRFGFERAWRWFPAIVVVATLTKPTLTVDLVAVTPVVAWLWARRDGRPIADVALPIVRRLVIPAVVIVSLQYLVMAFQVPPEYRQETVIEPFRVFFAFNLDQLWVWSGLLLPIVMLVFWGRELLADRYVEVCLLCTAVGFGLLFTMSSTNLGRDGTAALWFIVHPVALFLLFGTRRVAAVLRHRRTTRDVWGIVVVGAVAGLFIFTWIEFTSCQLGQACLT